MKLNNKIALVTGAGRGIGAATARLLKHHARSGAWVELSPGNPSQASRAGRDRDRSSPNCPSDMSEFVGE